MPSRGQENVSLLQKHVSAMKSTPASTQFTFTCDSHVPVTVRWPGQSSAPDGPWQGSHLAGHANKHAAAPQTTGALPGAPNSLGHDASPLAPGAKASQSRRKSRRRLEQELNIAARHRRQIAAESYYHQPPKAEDVWICEFCEYERIFGEPPRALIRDYEIKDRRHRQEEADRKRLLEKAKAKSRKGRKNGKVASKGHHGAHMADAGPAGDADGDQEAPAMHQGHSHSTQSQEEEYGDDFEEERAAMPPARLPATDDGGGRAIAAQDKT